MEPDERPQYAIAAVARRTGLSAHVLRAWERRYGVVEPVRGGGGGRLYSEADIVRLRLLRQLTEAGFSIGQVAPLRTADLLARVREQEVAARPAGEGVQARGPRSADRFAGECQAAVESLDGVRLHATLTRAVVALSSAEFVDELVGPLLRRVGELWADGELAAAHEHLLSAVVHRVLGWVMDTVPVDAGAPVLLATTPAGQRHELGAMLSGVVAVDEGWRVTYLGPDLPAADIVRAARVAGAAAVALSLVHGPEPAALRAEVREVRRGLPAGVRLLAGGAAAAEHRDALAGIGIDWLPDFAALRRALREIEAGLGPAKAPPRGTTTEGGNR